MDDEADLNEIVVDALSKESAAELETPEDLVPTSNINYKDESGKKRMIDTIWHYDAKRKLRKKEESQHLHKEKN